MISWVNLADAAAEIAATREEAGLGVRSLLTEPVAEVWRVPAVAAGVQTDLDVTLPEAAGIGVVALFAPRDGYLPPGTTVALSISNVAIGGTDVLALAAAPLALAAGRGCWWHWPAVPVVGRFIRLRFTAGAGDVYLQLGRLWVGPDFRPATPFSRDDHARGVLSAGVVERAAISGALSAQRGATVRNTRFTLPLLTNAEADVVEGMALDVANFGQVVACARTQAGASGVLLGRFEAPPAPRIVTPLLWSAGFSVLEDL